MVLVVNPVKFHKFVYSTVNYHWGLMQSTMLHTVFYTQDLSMNTTKHIYLGKCVGAGGVPELAYVCSYFWTLEDILGYHSSGAVYLLLFLRQGISSAQNSPKRLCQPSATPQMYLSPRSQLYFHHTHFKIYFHIIFLILFIHLHLSP